MRMRDGRGAEVELPKLTPALARLMNAPAEAQGDGVWEAQWEFLARVLPHDYLAGAVDGDELEDADVTALAALYVAVVAVYSQPVLEANARLANGTISQLDSVDLSKVYRVADAIKTISDASRRGFSAVR